APRATTRMIGSIPDSAAEIRARGGVASISDSTGDDNLRDLDPDSIAPFVCYLASDYAANVNAQTFLVYGDSISLVSQPRPERAIWNETGHWEMDELSDRARNYLTADILNPAPAQPR
ncbi:MAG: 3-hydroxyacyl-CoA dehydrogenase, partial [Chloroflexi bacterium]|nr:3-hydroxyacyl-CoA dehydrogenase [Chloroflexota bacterium]